MESKKSTCGGVMRPWPGSYRLYPYATGSGSGKEEMKEEVVRLGVELSLSVAESMFSLCDDIHTMLWFCRKLWEYTIPPSDPVSQRLLRVIHFVHTKEIKPTKGEYQDDGNKSANWELIRTTWRNFTDGVIVLHRLVLVLKSKGYNSFDDRLLSSAIAKYKQQVLKELDDKLRSAKDISEANGFARERIESNISDLWKSLFDEEAGGEVTPEVIRNEIVSELFPTLDMGKSLHSEIQSLPVYSPYILGTDFAKEELKEEVVRLGAKLLLYVAESMFLLCDDIPSMLWFCLKLWRDVDRDLTYASPVANKLLHAIHYVYSRHIKPKKGEVVHQNGGKSVQWELVLSTLKNFNAVIIDLHTLVLFFTVGHCCPYARELTSSVEEALKKVEEKLMRAKDISEARDDAAMESDFLELWRSLFDKETQNLSWTRKLITEEMLSDLFPPLSKGEDTKH